MKRIITLFYVLGICQILNAQCVNSKVSYNQSQMVSTTAEIDLGENSHPYGGTFQFFILKGAVKKEIFTTDILEFIESKREKNEDVMIPLSQNTKVLILSKNKISDPDFKALTNLYKLEE